MLLREKKFKHGFQTNKSRTETLRSIEYILYLVATSKMAALLTKISWSCRCRGSWEIVTSNVFIFWNDHEFLLCCAVVCAGTRMLLSRVTNTRWFSPFSFCIWATFLRLSAICFGMNFVQFSMGPSLLGWLSDAHYRHSGKYIIWQPGRTVIPINDNSYMPWNGSQKWSKNFIILKFCFLPPTRNAKLDPGK